MRAGAVWFCVFLIISGSVSADSLWDPESPGLLTGSGDLQVGDTVLVSIDSESTLSYNSSRVDSERVSIELSGGEGGDLFSFLPAGSSSGNQSLRGEESISVQADFAVVVTGIDDNGQLILQGGRTLAIQGQQETITLSGTVDPMLVKEDRSIPFSSIVNARLTYTTLLQPALNTVSPRDLVEQDVPQAPAQQEDAPAAEEGGATVPDTPTTILSLSDEKREELLLLYLNRLLDLIFR